MNRDRRRIDEVANHAAKDPRGVWGELRYALDERRSIYWRTSRARGGWMMCVWKRWVPRTNNTVRPPGMFGR